MKLTGPAHQNESENTMTNKDETKAEATTGGVQVEREVRLTLTEAEYQTMMTALHDYGHYCLGASVDLARVGARFRDGIDPLEGSRAAKRCGDRAFNLKGRIKELWEA